MNRHTLAWATAVLLTGMPAATQSALPHLLVEASPVLRPNSILQVQLDGHPGQRFAILADTSSGPVQLLGQEIRIGFSPNVIALASGTLPGFGRALYGIPLPNNVAGLPGLPIHFQAVTIDPATPNQPLHLSNGESTIPRVEIRAVVERFDNPRREGYTGTFDAASRDALRGSVAHRTVRTADPSFTPFHQPLLGPLSESGARVQNVFRASDLEATGQPEWITAIRWRAFGGQVRATRFDRVDLELAHTDVAPDFSIDPFTALPRFPDSGLETTFAQNLANARDRLVVRRGRYALRSGDLRADGYVDYRLSRPFPYNGVDSLLLDFRTGPNANPTPAGNGQVVLLPILSSPRPFARVHAVGGTRNMPGTVDPDRVRSGRGDNTVMDYQLEFTRIESVAVSPFRDSGIASPDYRRPSAATLLRGGSQVRFEFRGADDPFGSNATAFSSNVDDADGKPWLQIRVVLRADPRTLQVPEVDTLVIPVR